MGQKKNGALRRARRAGAAMGALRDATSKVDVVVIGSGIGGLCAGDDGARVVLGPRWVMASIEWENTGCVLYYIYA